PSGTPVLLLSDLGVNGRWWDTSAEPWEWRAFARLAARHGCPVVALAPCPPSRRPRWLDALFPVVTWDRTATVGGVHAVLR
ncbi:MAG TPA: hypothetical protein VGD43_11400, partial [Micromonospora sp.]